MSAPLWLPGAAIVRASNDGGSMLGGNAYMTWHTFEIDAEDITAVRGAEILERQGTQVTFVVDPVDGDIAQMLPPTRASRGLANLSGGVQTNRAGRVHIQVEVLARAGKPFTKLWTPKGKAAVLKVSAFAKAWAVPNVWPAGNPLGSYGAPHRRIGPGPSGHYGHSQWRENVHWDPGAIDAQALLVASSPASPIPNLPTKPQPVGKYDRAKTRSLQVLLEVAPKDGLWGSGTDSAALRMRAAARGSRSSIRFVQAVINTAVDGIWGPNSQRALVAWVRKVQALVGVTADGVWGPNTDRAFMAFRANNLNKF